MVSLSVYSAGKNIDNNDEFLYLYTPDCKYCVLFSPMYDQLMKTHSTQYSFQKIDASTPYGRSLMYKYRGMYVPYVVLINKKKNKLMRIQPACLLDTICVESELKQFRQ